MRCMCDRHVHMQWCGRVVAELRHRQAGMPLGDRTMSWRWKVGRERTERMDDARQIAEDCQQQVNEKVAYEQIRHPSDPT